MIDTLVFLKILASFFVGGSLVALVTILAEKLGTRIGGLLGGLPTNLVVAFYFQGLVMSAQTVGEEGAVASLVALSIFGPFCVAYVFLSPYGFAASLLGSLALWFLCALGVLYAEIHSFPLALVEFVIVSALCIAAIYRKEGLPTTAPQIPKTLSMHALRFLTAGGIISTSVLMAALGGPFLGGVCAVFPAAAVSSIVILTRTSGHLFAAGYIQHVLFSSMINCGTFVIAAAYFYPLLGLNLGTLVSYMIVALAATALYFVKHRTRKA